MVETSNKTFLVHWGSREAKYCKGITDQLSKTPFDDSLVELVWELQSTNVLFLTFFSDKFCVMGKIEKFVLILK